jgi:hypothetical protein
MASKLVPLAEAATILGVTPDELSEMRQRGDIYGYRDGASWKFKQEDLEKLNNDRAGASSGLGSGFGLSDLGLGNDFEIPASPPKAGAKPAGAKPADPAPAAPAPPPADSSSEVLLVSEGMSGILDESTASSTIIGKSGKQDAAAKDAAGDDDDLQLLDSGLGSGLGLGSELGLGSGLGSDIKPAAPDKPKKPAKESSSDILAGIAGAPGSGEIDLGGDLLGSGILGSSDILGSSGSNIFGGDSSNLLGDMGGASGNALDQAAGSSNVLGESAPVLVNPTESMVGSELAEEQTAVRKRGSELNFGDNALADPDDDDIFGGPKSDVTHRPSDSGILLIDPGDSGLSLDQPLDLGAGASGVLETTEFQLGGSAPGLEADDDFLLTPLDESSEDESDSGSQVIMLDTEGESDFGEATATLLSSQIPGMLEEDSPMGAFGAATGVSPAGQAAVMVPAVAETPFPGWLVGMLAVCMMTVGLSGALAYDLVRNMWSWQGPYPVNSAIMDMITGK